MTVQDNFQQKRVWTKANKFKLMMAGGNGFTRNTEYRKYIGKQYLHVKFTTPEYEYQEAPLQPQIVFNYGNHTKTLFFPRHTKLTSADVVITALTQALEWVASIKVNPNAVALEKIELTCYNEFIK